jgi:glycosyltransferase involved in cell wall biosynthesis
MWFGTGPDPVVALELPGVTYVPETLGLPYVLSRFPPDVVFALGAPHWLSWKFREIRQCCPACAIFVYAPVEGTLTNAEWLDPLRYVDGCILYTESAKDNVLELARVAPQHEWFPLPRLFVLPHGVDTRTFYPLPDRREVRRRIFPASPQLADAFIVLNANQPYTRKGIDLTIRGFAKFAAGKSPDVYLYIHHPRFGSSARMRLEQQAEEAGIADRLLLNTVNPDGVNLSDGELNQLYNACDVGLSTAMGEGWGLTSFEHACTRAAQALPNHTSFAENWSGAAEMIDATRAGHLWYEHADMHGVETGAVAGALERLYRDEYYRARLAEAAFQRAALPRFAWANIARQLYSILRTGKDS